MGRLYRHKRKGWEIHYRLWFPNGTDKKKWRSYHTKAEAVTSLQDIETLEHRSLKNTLTRDGLLYYLRRKYLSKEEATLLMGRAVVIPTLGELATVFLTRSKIECRPHSHSANRTRVNHLLAFFGADQSAAEIFIERVEAYRAHRLKTISATTVNKEIIKLAQLLDIALEKGAITENAARVIRRLRDTRERKPRALTKDEIKKLLITAKAEKQLLRGLAHEIVTVYLYTGMRRGELVWLEWENVDLEKRRITIQAKRDGGFTTKSGKARIVGIAVVIGSVLATLPRTGRYVFGGYFPPHKRRWDHPCL